MTRDYWGDYMYIKKSALKKYIDAEVKMAIKRAFRDEYLGAPIYRLVRRMRDDLIDLGHDPRKSHLMRAIERFANTVNKCNQRLTGNTVRAVNDIKQEYHTLQSWSKFIKDNKTKQTYDSFLDKIKHETFQFINRALDRDGYKLGNL